MTSAEIEASGLDALIQRWTELDAIDDPESDVLDELRELADAVIPLLIAQVRELRRERDDWRLRSESAEDALRTIDREDSDEYTAVVNRADAALSEAADLRAENERLRAALAWYADGNNHVVPALTYLSAVYYDAGDRAREALRGK